MKQVLLFLLLSVASAFADTTWPGVKYTEVRAYAWDVHRKGSGSLDGVIRDDMTFEAGVLNKDGAKLSPEQVKRLLAAVTGEHDPHPTPGCYNPHNAFVFYNADKKPVAFVEICFDCLIYRISPDDPVPGIDLLSLAVIFTEHKLPVGYHGFDHFKKRFLNWQRNYHLWKDSKDSTPSSPAPSPGTDKEIPGLVAPARRNE